jgi:menaquinone-dependent protoporphyrinogen oxidase
MTPITRRHALGALAGILAIGAGIWAAAWRPAPALVASSCEGEAGMSKKILVAYATRTGSTGEVADAIAKRLCAGGLSAEVRPIADLADLEGYAGAVLGSPIRFAAWLPEMTDFIARHCDALAKLPVAYFTMHMLALGDLPSDAAERTKYTAKAKDLIAPVDEAFFAGKIDTARLSLVDRLLVRMVRAPIGDKRDWARIGAWADALGLRLA